MPGRRNMLAVAVLAAVMCVAAPAFAQDNQDAEGEAKAAAPIPSNGEELGTGEVEQDLQLYWGGRRKVEVVQKRLFTKDSRMEFSLFTGIIPNDPFLTYVPIGGRFNYYFVESISFELAGSWTGIQSNSELKDFLKNNDRIRGDVDLLDIQQWRVGGSVVWSPFYGKLALLQRKLSHFDINLVGGLGVLSTESPKADRTGVDTEFKPEGILGAGFRFFLTEDLTFRLDYRQFIFQKVGGGVSTPSEITLGVSFFTE